MEFILRYFLKLSRRVLKIGLISRMIVLYQKAKVGKGIK
jgi:hypothetical protein